MAQPAVRLALVFLDQDPRDRDPGNIRLGIEELLQTFKSGVPARMAPAHHIDHLVDDSRQRQRVGRHQHGRTIEKDHIVGLPDQREQVAHPVGVQQI